MIHSKTKKTPQPSSLQAKEIRLKAPRSWAELSQEQLRYVLDMMTNGERSMAEVKTYMFARFCGIEVEGLRPEGYKCIVGKGKDRRVVYLQTWQAQSFLHQFDFVESGEDYDTRLEEVGGMHPVDKLLHDVCFLDYLNAEKWYQLYSQHHDPKYLDKITEILYRPDEDKANNSSLHTPHSSLKKASHSSLKKASHSSLKYTEAERLNTMLWYSHVKAAFRQVFPHLFRSTSSADEDFNVIASINAQVRLLTGGDITKEDAVFEKDCWRALYELDAQAKEAADMKRELAKAKQR